MSSKGRSLPLTELANLYRKSVAQQEIELKNFVKPMGPVKSYGPSKKCAAEACGATGRLLEATEPLRGTALRQYLGKIAKGDIAADFNWPIVEALSQWVLTENIRGLHRNFEPVTLVGSGRKDLVSGVIVVRDGRGTMLTLDPRRKNFLTRNGVLVVQSLVHHLLRMQYPDLADLDISVLQFPETRHWLDEDKDMRKRQVLEHRMGDAEPIPFAELRAGVAETLGIFDVLRRREPAAPKASGMDDMFEKIA
jgi:hypothetical protein